MGCNPVHLIVYKVEPPIRGVTHSRPDECRSSDIRHSSTLQAGPCPLRGHAPQRRSERSDDVQDWSLTLEDATAVVRHQPGKFIGVATVVATVGDPFRNADSSPYESVDTRDCGTSKSGGGLSLVAWAVPLSARPKCCRASKKNGRL